MNKLDLATINKIANNANCIYKNIPEYGKFLRRVLIEKAKEMETYKIKNKTLETIKNGNFNIIKNRKLNNVIFRDLLKVNLVKAGEDNIQIATAVRNYITCFLRINKVNTLTIADMGNMDNMDNTDNTDNIKEEAMIRELRVRMVIDVLDRLIKKKLDIDESKKYKGKIDDPELSLIFNFAMIRTFLKELLENEKKQSGGGLGLAFNVSKFVVNNVLLSLNGLTSHNFMYYFMGKYKSNLARDDFEKYIGRLYNEQMDPELKESIKKYYRERMSIDARIGLLTAEEYQRQTNIKYSTIIPPEDGVASEKMGMLHKEFGVTKEILNNMREKIKNDSKTTVEGEFDLWAQSKVEKFALFAREWHGWSQDGTWVEGIKDKIMTQLKNNNLMKKIQKTMSDDETKLVIAFIVTLLVTLKSKDNISVPAGVGVGWSGVVPVPEWKGMRDLDLKTPIMSSLVDLGIRISTSGALYYYINDNKLVGTSAISNALSMVTRGFLISYGFGMVKKLWSCYEGSDGDYDTMATCSVEPTELSAWHEKNYNWEENNCTYPGYDYEMADGAWVPSLKITPGGFGHGHCYQEVAAAIYDFGINNAVRTIEMIFDKVGPQISGLVGLYLSLNALSSMGGSFFELWGELDRHNKIITAPKSPQPGSIEPNSTTGSLNYSKFDYEIKDFIGTSNIPPPTSSDGGILGKAYMELKSLNESEIIRLKTIVQEEHAIRELVAVVENLRLKEDANKIAEKQAEAQIKMADAAVKQANAAQVGNEISEKQVDAAEARNKIAEEQARVAQAGNEIAEEQARVQNELRKRTEEQDQSAKKIMETTLINERQRAERVMEELNDAQLKFQNLEVDDLENRLAALEASSPPPPPRLSALSAGPPSPPSPLPPPISVPAGGKNVKQNRVRKSKNKKCKRKPCRKTKRKNSKHKPRYKTLRNNRKRKPIHKTLRNNRKRKPIRKTIRKH